MGGVSSHFKKLLKLNYNGKVLKYKELKDLTTFKIGGIADLYLEICTLENFIKVMLYLEEYKLNYFVLGSGSKILVSDNGYRGIVIKLLGDFDRINLINESSFECGAGVKLSVAFAKAKNMGLSGLEDSAGIPATIGGAVYMNAGAYNFEMSKIVDYVIAYNDGKINYYTADDCEFSYRSSIFQRNKGVILRVGLKFEKKDIEQIQNRYLEVIQKRKECQPLEYPSAGSVFKRREDVIVSKMLDKLGFKGRMNGGAEVSQKHANFIINKGANAQDVYDLINDIKKQVYNVENFRLESEIIFLGEFDEINK